MKEKISNPKPNRGVKREPTVSRPSIGQMLLYHSLEGGPRSSQNILGQRLTHVSETKEALSSFERNRFWVLLSAISVNAVFATSIFDFGPSTSFKNQIEKKVRAHINFYSPIEMQNLNKSKTSKFLQELQKRESLKLSPDVELAQ